jgi:hypothetical protein
MENTICNKLICSVYYPALCRCVLVGHHEAYFVGQKYLKNGDVDA